VAELEGWRWCPRCRTELRGDASRVECPSCGFVSYASSKPTAGALVEDGEGRVLLARPLDGLRRELREETGLDVEPLDFLGAWMDTYGGDSTAEATLNLYWTARVREGEPHPADDVDQLRWFAPGELPAPDELAFENVPLVLSAWRARHEHA
jgi:8-oxo-dGTP pyrophosphatase MutT (NUDIX family)